MNTRLGAREEEIRLFFAELLTVSRQSEKLKVYLNPKPGKKVMYHTLLLTVGL